MRFDKTTIEIFTTMPQSLDDAPVLHLLVELLKEGKAEVLPELAPLEPIHVDLIVASLHRRTGMELGKDFGPWYRWFIEKCPDADAHERETLRLMKEMVETTRFFVDRLSKRRKPQ